MVEQSTGKTIEARTIHSMKGIVTKVRQALRQALALVDIVGYKPAKCRKGNKRNLPTMGKPLAVGFTATIRSRYR